MVAVIAWLCTPGVSSVHLCVAARSKRRLPV